MPSCVRLLRRGHGRDPRLAHHQNYNPGFQNGAIKPYIRATGWVLRNLTVQKNMYLGVNASACMKILGGHYSYNDKWASAATTGDTLSA